MESTRKHPDHLADSCKHLSVNWMTAGLRLPRYSQGFFLLSATIQTYLILKQAVGPSVLQTFGTCTGKP